MATEPMDSMKDEKLRRAEAKVRVRVRVRVKIRVRIRVRVRCLPPSAPR